jgi:cell division septation protein DedD
MAKRGNSGDRVLESKHVIGLFLLMLLFSGVFFTLGYVMGRNQLDAQVRAANGIHLPFTDGSLKSAEMPAKHAAKKNAPETPVNPPENSPGESPAGNESSWGFYENTKSSKPSEPLHPVSAAPTAKPMNVRDVAPTRTKNAMNTPLIPNGSYVLQVAALTRESDALALANTLQKKRFPAVVLSPHGDKFYRVQVGPYADQKAADAAKKGLEGAGFKAIVKR